MPQTAQKSKVLPPTGSTPARQMSDQTTDASADTLQFYVGVSRLHRGRLERGSPLWDAHTKSFHPELVTIDILANIIRDGYSISARVKDSYRHSRGFISAQHIGLDYDNETVGISDLNSLQNDPFIGQYATILHTSSSHTADEPRARVIFVLDQPITSAKQYREYVEALHWYLEQQCDAQAKDAARLWFGAPGCEMRTFDNVLPLEVLDAIVKAHRDARRAERKQADQQRKHSPITTSDPAQAVTAAITAAAPGNRNDTGFRLACKLRDSGIDQNAAETHMKQFQQAVETLAADDPYTWTEASTSLRSAYDNPRTGISQGVEETLAIFEQVAWTRKQERREGNVHFTMKSIFAVIALMRDTGSTRNVDISCRRLVPYGVSRPTAMRHLKAMRAAGLLQLDEASKGGKAHTYSIPADMRQSETNIKAGITATATATTTAYLSHFVAYPTAAYTELQNLPCFMYGARIHPQLWRAEWGDYDAATWGAAMQRLVAALASGEADSMGQLAKLANMNGRAVQRHFGILQRMGLADQELDGQRRIPFLVENWYERLIEMLPAFTTFGRIELNMHKAARDQRIFHSDKADYYERIQKARGKHAPGSIQEKLADNEAMAATATQSEAAALRAACAAQAARKRYCEQHNHSFVPIGDNGRPADDKPQQTRVNGRRLSPRKERHTGIDSSHAPTTAAQQPEPEAPTVDLIPTIPATVPDNGNQPAPPPPAPPQPSWVTDARRLESAVRIGLQSMDYGTRYAAEFVQAAVNGQHRPDYAALEAKVWLLDSGAHHALNRAAYERAVTA